MEKSHQEILRRLRKNIVDDLDVYNGVISPLTSEYILREEDVKDIEAGLTKKQRAQILLDILPKRGPWAFDSFHQSLRHHYSWLSDDMDRLLQSRGMATNDMASPNIPPVSPMTVTREEKTSKLKDALRNLEPSGYIALHGMKGFGKSCLTASSLRDTKLVKGLFQNKVFWLKFGYERPINEEILIQLNTLYHLVRNLELLPEAVAPEPLKETLVRFLKQHFNKPEHRKALLILDDVCDKRIIDIFDFECKTLVITADIDVLFEREKTVIEMNDGFTEAETLGLFAKVLGTEVQKLPWEAKRIHEECKGMPLLIAMFSAQFDEFKHDMAIRSDRWKYYLNCLRKKDSSNKVMEKFFEKQEAIFDMCIGQLPQASKKRYEDLAIFSEDVNIMPKTLEILWEGQPFHVEELMLDLCHKSLAAKQWNDGLKSYIYGVHDLLLCHLKKKLTPIKLRELHREFIEKYRKYCNGDFSKLPDDNYSYSYIGHHLEQAELYDVFPILYFDFDFLQAKISKTGLSDLLIDLKKYRKYITKNYDEEYEEKVVDLENFLESQASVIAKHRRKNCLDLIQIAMNHSTPGFVSTNAKNLASERVKNLYFLHEKKLQEINRPVSEELPVEISTSCFTDDPNAVLIGTGRGDIILWNCEARKQMIFNGFAKKNVIKKIVVSEQGDCFLAMGDNGVIKLFLLNEDSYDNGNVHSPRQKQTFWTGIFNRSPQDDSVVTFSLPDEIILDMTFGFNDSCVAACTNRGGICVWDRRGNVISRTNHTLSNSLRCIAFTQKGTLLHTMDETNGVLVTYTRQNNEYVYISQYNPDLQRKRIIFFRNIPDLDNTLIVVTEDKATRIIWFNTDNDQLHSYNKQQRGNIESGKTVYVCAAITNDGKYLILGDSAGFVNIWNISHYNEIFLPVATYQSRVTCLDTYWLNQDCHIICGSENTLLHKWTFLTDEKSQSKRKLLFDAVLESFDKIDIVAKETASNTIVALHGGKTIAESETINDKVVNLSLSSNGKKIVYVTESGGVTLFDIESRKMIVIFKLPQSTEFVKFVNVRNDDVIVCRESADRLKVWHNAKVTHIVENAGHVISLHSVNKDCLITVSRNGAIILWDVSDIQWRKMNVQMIETDFSITFASLSGSKRFLAILKENKKLIVYDLLQDDTVSPMDVKVLQKLKHYFPHRLGCCEFSLNEQYLAVGLENGDISIIDISIEKETHKLSFHGAEIKQLHWAPLTVEAPILLSINEEELVWWNISLVNNATKRKRRSLIGIQRSLSNPCVSLSSNLGFNIPGSQSVNFASEKFRSGSTSYESSAENSVEGSTDSRAINSAKDESERLREFWKGKEGKYPENPAFLSVVQLPACVEKVAVSHDFAKFLTVDISGSISTYKLFGFH